jgi:molecular chaperone DnaJ
MTQKDYYTVLGVGEDADPKEIKKRYRDLAKRYHPDRNPGDKASEARFKEIQEAYDVLGEPGKRGKYDNLRKRGASGFSNVDFEELFGRGGSSSGFGGAICDLFERAGVGRRGGRRRPVRGDDLQFEVEITFEQAAFGGATTVVVPRTENCGACGGTGAASGTGAETCPTCGGTGNATMSQGAFSISRPCPQCLGRGRVIKNPCTSCGGNGSRRASRKLEVKIPAGVGDGGKIRLRGEGEQGPPGTPPGDLLLTIRVSGHDRFRRKGLNVESALVVDIVEASLGAKKEVETLSGKVDLNVPAGVQPGARLRLKGRGVRDHRGRAGDHFVTVRVEVPRNLSERRRRLLEEYAQAE